MEGEKRRDNLNISAEGGGEEKKKKKCRFPENHSVMKN